jgi:hypothetical protein
MRPLTFLCCAAVLAACGKPEDRAAEISTGRDTLTTGAGAPSRPATISLTDVAGKWKTFAINETGDTVGEAELLATADTSGWTLTFPKRKPIPLRVVAVGGDSIVTEAGPYESFQRQGAQIRSRAVNRFQGDKLVATIEARYTMGGRDSVTHIRAEGTRVP